MIVTQIVFIYFELFPGLHPLAKQHGEILSRNNVDGAELMSLTWNQLGSMNVSVSEVTIYI